MIDRRLYLCTPGRPDLASFVVACLRGGVDVVQLRDKVLPAGDLLSAARRLRDICSSWNVPFIVNDRPDLALGAEADGVHVGQDDVPPSLARRILGPHAVVGLSTHTPEELARVQHEPVDYISAGPVEPTPTKPGRPPTGIEYVALALARSTKPVFVTGGITPERVPALAAVGVRHFVAVRYLTEARDPQRAAHRLRAAIEQAVDTAG